MSQETAITFEAEITEIGCALDEKGWDGPDVKHFIEKEGVPFEDTVSEITKGDDDPFFVNLLVAREGLGTGKPQPKYYTPEAIDDIVQLLPGIQGYKGHQRPGREDWEYRDPQMKILMSKPGTMKCPQTGKQIKVARAKAYVSRAAGTLRTNISEKMAGPISLRGKARLVNKGDMLEVKRMLALKHVDFCNPGTGGIPEAGVESVVSEMDNENGDDERRTSRMTDQNTRLNMSQLRVEYEAEIGEIGRNAVQEATPGSKAPLETEVAEMKAGRETAEKELGETKIKLEASEKKVKEQETEISEMRADNEKLEAKTSTHDLKTHRDTVLKKLGEDEKLSTEVQEMIGKRVDIAVLEDDKDLAKSKAALDKGVKKAFEEVKEVIEMTGGSLTGKGKRKRVNIGGDSDTGGGNPARGGNGNDGGRSKKDIANVMLTRGAKALVGARRRFNDNDSDSDSDED